MGVSSHDTFGRVFHLIDAKRFERALRGWISDVVGAAQKHRVIDGKCVTRWHDGEQRAIHLVSAYVSYLNVARCQEQVADTGNEIDAIPAVLEGCFASVDMMDCQREIAHTICERGGTTCSRSKRPVAPVQWNQLRSELRRWHCFTQRFEEEINDSRFFCGARGNDGDVRLFDQWSL